MAQKANPHVWDRKSQKEGGWTPAGIMQEGIQRLFLIRDAFLGHGEKYELPSRGNRETHFVESWLEGVSLGGIHLKKSQRMVIRMRELSPHVDGLQIETLAKVLSPQQIQIHTGTPYPEEQTFFEKMSGGDGRK